MSSPTNESLLRRTLDECRELYVSSGRLCADMAPQLVSMLGEKYVQLMDDLHRALALKIFVSICSADRQWSDNERNLASTLLEHLWGKRLTGARLEAAIHKASDKAAKLRWYSLIRPFEQVAPLRDRLGELETVVMRLANIVARADGVLHATEAGVIKSIQAEVHRLRPIPIDSSSRRHEANVIRSQAMESLKQEAADIHSAALPTKLAGADRRSQTTAAAPAAVAISLKDTLAELDSMIGLARIKGEIRTLTNFLKVQQRRSEAGLPETDVSLHMVFTGNPGTGKTCVARIVGRIFGALGILKRGHLVETDRSGLVAEFVGQTGPKTNKKIDEALDGVLFIDEAYSLVARKSDDPYGREAVQTLLKRAEDDRHRLVVILAGYPAEIGKLLESNPGLSSRFSRHFDFEDYSPLELARIFGSMCDKNHYTLTSATRVKTILGLAELHRRRDQHFGNGRTVRNLFELAIRRMADRIADIEQLSTEMLTRLDEADIEFNGLPQSWLRDINGREPRFQVACPGCSQSSRARGALLGNKVRCSKCQHDFIADWGEPVAT